MGEYQPSYVKNTARKAVTTAASMPSDISGSDTADIGGGGAPDAATGAVRKQPTTSTISMRPTPTLMMRVTVLPIRSPPQCSTVKPPMLAMASTRGLMATAGHSVPMNAAAVSAP